MSKFLTTTASATFFGNSLYTPRITNARFGKINGGGKGEGGRLMKRMNTIEQRTIMLVHQHDNKVPDIREG